MDRLPALADELVRRRAAVIVASGGVAVTGSQGCNHDDPNRLSYLGGPSQSRLCLKLRSARRQPNGINFFIRELAAKQLELLRELVPATTRVAVLVNPANAAATEITLRGGE